MRIEFDAHMLLATSSCGIAINHLHGQLLVGTNTRRRGVTIDVVEGPARSSSDFDSFPLLEGVYDLTVAVTDHTEVHPYDHWDKRLRFEVDQIGHLRRRHRVVVDGQLDASTRPTAWRADASQLLGEAVATAARRSSSRSRKCHEGRSRRARAR